MSNSCIIPDCTATKIKAHGWCSAHYQRWMKYGDPLGRRLTAVERYEASIDRLTTPAGCHVWVSQLSRGGYGKFYSNGKHWRAHRFGWTLYVGPIPDGLVIRHKVCDNPPCQKIEHLDVGTFKDNTRDMYDKGRQRFGSNYNRGEQHPRAKLTRADVDCIRASYVRGVVTHAALADEFGVSKGLISLILTNRVWQ